MKTLTCLLVLFLPMCTITPDERALVDKAVVLGLQRLTKGKEAK